MPALCLLSLYSSPRFVPQEVDQNGLLSVRCGGGGGGDVCGGRGLG